MTAVAITPHRHAIAPGARVRDRTSGQLGVVVDVRYDNSCGDPDCCGGRSSDMLYVRFPCGHLIDYESARLEDSEMEGWPDVTVEASAPEAPPLVRHRMSSCFDPTTDLEGMLADPQGTLTLRPDALGVGCQLLTDDWVLGWMSKAALVAAREAFAAAGVDIPALPEGHPTSVTSQEVVTGDVVLEDSLGTLGEVTHLEDRDSTAPGLATLRLPCGHPHHLWLDEMVIHRAPRT